MIRISTNVYDDKQTRVKYSKNKLKTIMQKK